MQWDGVCKICHTNLRQVGMNALVEKLRCIENRFVITSRLSELKPNRIVRCLRIPNPTALYG